MLRLIASVAVIQAGQVLLTKREDFEVWCLPGGHVEEGETLAQAARREVSEETGLEVELTRLVGIYSRPHWGEGSIHIVVFAAEPMGGELRPAVEEVIEARYFSPEALPEDLMRDHRQRILDALEGKGGSVVRSQDSKWPFDQKMSFEELYELRDKSGLSRQQFYLKYLGEPDEENEILEVGEEKDNKGISEGKGEKREKK
jgi:ADP-ribose pyrophosphatase YjhB (NUDIX family)